MISESRKYELVAESCNTMAVWLQSLVDKSAEKDKVSSHFQDEIDYGGMTQTEALFCQLVVSEMIDSIRETEQKYRNEIPT